MPRASLSIMLCLLLACTLLPARAAWSQFQNNDIANDVENGVEEVVITGRMTGPPLWQVRNGDNSLWIFGYLSPLPEDLDFDTTRIERVIAEADAVLDMPDLKSSDSLGPFKLIGLYRQFRKMRVNDDDKKLEDVLPAELYQRLLVLKDNYGPRGNGFFKLRPLMAALALDQAAQKKSGLKDGDAVIKSINRLIKRHKVPRTEIPLETDLAYKDLLNEVDHVSLAAEISCMATTIASIETDIEDRESRARAWAYGYMAEIHAMQFPDQQAVCFGALTEGAALRSLLEQGRVVWLEHAEQALASNKSTFAIVDMQPLLARDGLLEQLRNKGYEVIDP